MRREMVDAALALARPDASRNAAEAILEVMD